MLRLDRLSINSVLWATVFTALFVTVGILTWKRWTTPAFPLDAGWEMMIPRLIAQGRTLYSEIRCSYGPLGCWIQGSLCALFGPHIDVLWWTNIIRFFAWLGLLWMLARRMLGPAMATLAISSFIFSLYFSFVVPYTSGIGWGALLLTGGVLCGAKQWDQRDSQPARRRLTWFIASVVLLSLAATAKHEYTLNSAIIIAIFIIDLVWRDSNRSMRFLAITGLSIIALTPFAVIAVITLSSVPLKVLLFNNLWIPDYMNTRAGAVLDGLRQGLCPWKAILLIESMGLLAAFIAVISLLSAREVRSTTDHKDHRNHSTNIFWVLLLAGLIIAGVVQWFTWSSDIPRKGLLGFSRHRIRELIEYAALLCLPLSVSAVIIFIRRGRKQGFRQTWLQLTPSHRVGMICLISYLAFVVREVPNSIGLTRQPFTSLLFAWLLVALIPQWFRWQPLARRLWKTGVVLLLLAGTICGLDNIIFLQTRPSTFLHGDLGSMYVWQRRKPFTPQWFQDAMTTVRDHCDIIQGKSIVCVPHGAFINALLDLDWPMRDPTWYGYMRPWIAEDLNRHPPAFILVMDHEEITAAYPQAAAIIRKRYVPIETNRSGMTLYKYQPGAPGEKYDTTHQSRPL